MKKWIQINPKDNVIIALTDFLKGTMITFQNGHSFTLQEAITKGHKINTRLKNR